MAQGVSAIKGVDCIGPNRFLFTPEPGVTWTWKNKAGPVLDRSDPKWKRRRVTAFKKVNSSCYQQRDLGLDTS